MFDDWPDEYTNHLQEIGQALMNGTLDKAGAVLQLVRRGWDHEEAHAAVTEVAEQIETNKKLLRDAARVLDDSPLGQARCAARLQEMGLSEHDSQLLVEHCLKQRHQTAGRLRDVLRRIRHGRLGRTLAVEQLTDRGMESILASTLVDVYTDSAYLWAREWLTLSRILTAGALLTTGVIALCVPRDLMGWLGASLTLFLVLPLVVLIWSWKNWHFWRRWTLANQTARECPRSCSPVVMLAQGRGRSAATITLTEWGLPRDTATELVNRRARLHRRSYLWIILIGLLFVAIALGTSIITVINEPNRLAPIALIGATMSAVGGALLYRGLRGWRRFARL
jgi:hypothetical protein